MLRIIQNTSAAGAMSYYSTSDYYSEGQELIGQWRGQGAQRLGLSGQINQADWDALCSNRHPQTSQVLTIRQKQNRRVGYDFNFHVPKSVSTLYGLSRDERILDAFQQAVDETMKDMEMDMRTRVRQKGRNEDRITGNMTWGQFVHFTSRPVDGVPDPHLHAHCFVFNTTWDQQEKRWKAGQFSEIKRDAPYFEAVFHSRLAGELSRLGLPIQRTKKGWEIEGIPQSALAKFSRRTALIEEKAREEGILDAKEKAELGAKTRERKKKELSLDQLRALWQVKLTSDEQSAIDKVARQIGGKAVGQDSIATTEAMDRAIKHSFERKSVAPERLLLAEALKRSVGKASVDTIYNEYSKRSLMVAERDGRRMVTTPEVLAEEQDIIDYARDGRGTCPRFGNTSHIFRDPVLNEGQRKAVQHVLTSPDRVILIRGAAGVGKTTMMSEAVAAIEANGKRVFTFAPSADAARGVLRKEGFDNAETVARLLVDPKLQQQIHGQVIWIDEAGLLATRTMSQVFDLAEKIDARIVLSGDRRQHGSVERGSALRLLETEAGLLPVEIKEIQRQKGDYKQAVMALSEGRSEDGFRQLDQLGWIREVDDAERYKQIATDYVQTVAGGKTALVVSPTHREGERITSQIRWELKQKGKLAGKEQSVLMLEQMNLTQAERSDAVNYEDGDVLVFHQNAKGYGKGERIIVGPEPLPLNQAERFQVYRQAILPVAACDLLRITRNGTTADGEHRLNNGAVYQVKGFTKAGDIQLRNGWIVSRNFGHLAHGYVVTSHASQGKTVDRALIGISAESFPAASREQFYVSASRARQQVTVYTDDKMALLDAVSQSDERLTATEFLSERQKREWGRVLQETTHSISTDPKRATREQQREELAYERE